MMFRPKKDPKAESIKKKLEEVTQKVKEKHDCIDNILDDLENFLEAKKGEKNV